MLISMLVFMLGNLAFPQEVLKYQLITSDVIDQMGQLIDLI